MFALRTTFAQIRMVGGALLTITIVVAGCGSRTDSPPADVIVTLDGVHHECVVALAKEEHGSSIACGEVIAFMKDELRLPTGATYDLRTTPEVSKDESTRLRENLNTAGYRFVGAR